MSRSNASSDKMRSPTRMALLTGRNHHSVGMGGIETGTFDNQLVAPEERILIALTRQ